MRPRITRLALVVLMAPSASACAAIWGFQDAVDRLDGAGDGFIADAMAGGGDDRRASDGPGSVDTGDTGEEVGAIGGDGSDDGARGSSDAHSTRDAAGTGAPDAGAADAGADAPAQTTCGGNGTCVPPPRTPWTGPFEIITGAPLAMLPSCDAAFPVDAYNGLGPPVAPPATCTCACGAPTGATCSSPVATFFSDGACTQSCGTDTTIGPFCTLLGNCGYWVLGGSSAQGGSCMQSASKRVTPPVSVADARLCGTAVLPPASSCGGGMVCAPPGNFSSAGYCVARTGAGFPCPLGYPVVKTFYGASTDTRDCSACSCAGVAGASCGGASISAYNDRVCTRSQVSATVPQTCNGFVYKSAQFAGQTPIGGSCMARGGQPIGMVAETNPTTICCTR